MSHPSAATVGVDELVLATLPASDPTHRLLLVVLGGQLELRHQSFAAGVGWFTQQRCPIEPEQAAALRGSLGLGAAVATRAQRAHAASSGSSPILRIAPGTRPEPLNATPSTPVA